MLLLPLLLVAGGIVALRERDNTASADAPVHGQDDADPIEVPEPSATTPTTLPTPSTLEPDPVVPGGASRVVTEPATPLVSQHVVAGVPALVTVLGQAGVPSSGVSAVALNVTVTGATAAGQVTVLPSGGPATAARHRGPGGGR